MANDIKNQQKILDKLNIKSLNPMQIETHRAIESASDVVLLSPTGTGKTLAFLLPIVESLDVSIDEIQALIIVPSRELAIQIEQVIREMGSGYKTNAVYGGRAGSKDRMELKHRPAILIGTPGRVADHLRRETFSVDKIKTLVLDEFDKSLEVGFEEEMTQILDDLPKIKKRILTSATKKEEIPKFVQLLKPVFVDYLDQKLPQLEVKILNSEASNKMEALIHSLSHIAKSEQGIIFCNFKDTIDRISSMLKENGISHGCFYGGMEQVDRESALIKFRNGTHQLIVATDLAARGIDVPQIKFILHYQMPPRVEEFTHRNGRTARMNAEGTAYILQWEKDRLPDYINTRDFKDKAEEVKAGEGLKPTQWQTLFISGGRKDKISKGDVAGLFLKKGELTKDELGMIEIKQDCAFVGVRETKVKALLPLVNNSHLKKKKVRVTLI